MKDVFTSYLAEEMRRDEKVVVLDADLAKCIGTNKMWAEFPDRMFDVGVAEANMASIAAGLSAYGFKPVITSFAPFVTRRCADQIMISIAYAKQNVKIIGTDPGICAELNGGTHMPLEDIGMLRSIPNVTIYEPTDAVELARLMPQIMAKEGVVYVRLHRKNPTLVYSEDENRAFDLYKADVVREGKDVSIVASGIMVDTAVKASEALAEEGISCEVVCCHTIKPIDAETILRSVKKTNAVVTCENHNVMGGLRSAVCEVLCENYPAPVRSVGVKEQFGEVGKVPYLRKAFRLEEVDVIAAVKEVLAAKK